MPFLRYNFAKVQVSEAFLKLFSDTLTGVSFKDSITFSLSSAPQSHAQNSQQQMTTHSTNSYHWMSEYSIALRMAQEGLGPEPSLTLLNPLIIQEEQKRKRREEDARKVKWLESYLLQEDKSKGGNTPPTLSSFLTGELELDTGNIPNLKAEECLFLPLREFTVKSPKRNIIPVTLLKDVSLKDKTSKFLWPCMETEVLYFRGV